VLDSLLTWMRKRLEKKGIDTKGMSHATIIITFVFQHQVVAAICIASMILAICAVGLVGVVIQKAVIMVLFVMVGLLIAQLRMPSNVQKLLRKFYLSTTIAYLDLLIVFLGIVTLLFFDVGLTMGFAVAVLGIAFSLYFNGMTWVYRTFMKDSEPIMA
jgi:hypothetical protein